MKSSDDPTSRAILTRARDGLNETRQRCEEASEYLRTGEYLAAIGTLAGLD